MEAKERKLQDTESRNQQLQRRLEETHSTLTQKLNEAERQIQQVSCLSSRCAMMAVRIKACTAMHSNGPGTCC